MVVKFDNLADVTSKFVGTVCYYDKQAVYVKNCDSPNGVEFKAMIQGSSGSALGRGKWIDIHDEAFRYRDYNIGYANAGGYACWWFRQPHKQYQQGLKKSQMGWFSPDNPHIGMEHPFQYSPAFIKMLENNYPSVDEVNTMLRGEKAQAVAFHRDFALQWDKIHQDHILMYRGQQIGVSLNPKLTEFRLVNEFQHVKEALKEALT